MPAAHSFLPIEDLFLLKSGQIKEGLQPVSAFDKPSRREESKSQGQIFIRNEQLCGHYRSIGLALLAYEKEAPVLLRSISEAPMRNLRVALSFLPNSLLDSYLEDLLDLAVGDRELFIATSGLSPRRLLVALPFAGLFGAVALGLYLSTLDLPQSVCIASIVISSIPFALLWEYVPRSSNRRLFFARIIAAELSNRRGHKEMGTRKLRIELKDVMVPTLGRGAVNIH